MIQESESGSENLACAKCSRILRVGDDCFQVARGVIGTRDFIPLEAEILCSEACLDAGLGRSDDSNSRIHRPRRVP
jgi:hypothetical protein